MIVDTQIYSQEFWIYHFIDYGSAMEIYKTDHSVKISVLGFKTSQIFKSYENCAILIF